MDNLEKIEKVAELLIDTSALIDVAKSYCEQQGNTPVEVTLNYAQICLNDAQECLSDMD